MSSAISLSPSHDVVTPTNKDGSDSERSPAILDHVLEHTCAEYAIAGVDDCAVGAFTGAIALVGTPLAIAAGVSGYFDCILHALSIDKTSKYRRTHGYTFDYKEWGGPLLGG